MFLIAFFLLLWQLSASHSHCTTIHHIWHLEKIYVISAWVWVNPRSWWWTGRPGVLQFMGSQRVGHDWATELNWTDVILGRELLKQIWVKLRQVGERNKIILHSKHNDSLISVLYEIFKKFFSPKTPGKVTQLKVERHLLYLQNSKETEKIKNIINLKSIMLESEVLWKNQFTKFQWLKLVNQKGWVLSKLGT